jgi:phosphohistidine swiveling domain-containing protein
MTLTFEAPEKGQWISLRDHFPRALTPEYERLLCEAMPAGEAIPFAEYGMPVATLEVRPVHGHVYVAPKPLLGGYSNALPPGPILWVAARLVPAFRRRNKAAKAALAARPWMADAQRWDAVERDEWVASCAALQAEDPAILDTPSLVDHLRRAQAHADKGYRRHFSLHGPDLIPTGLLLVWCSDRGVEADAVLPVLTGSSPASLGRGRALDALRAAVAAAGVEAASIDEVRAVAGAELDAFLAEHGWRLITGYDIDSLALGELPALVTNLARPAVPRPDVAGEGDAVAALRGRIAVADHPELERLVHEARATFGMRDDNGGVTAAWPVGLLRRAMLAAGARLAEQGRLHDPHHGLEVTVDDLVAMLSGPDGPSADDARRAQEERMARSELVPPLQLGPDVDVPIRALPSAMATVARAQLVLRDTFTAALDGRRDLDGDGVGTEVVQGRACVAVDPADALTRLEPGDVLVAYGTTPAYNMALAMAAAVVVEEGGLLSHAAVIARELGLTAVIGAGGAMATIPDGAIIEVDPGSGRVRVLVGPAGTGA